MADVDGFHLIEAVDTGKLQVQDDRSRQHDLTAADALCAIADEAQLVVDPDRHLLNS